MATHRKYNDPTWAPYLGTPQHPEYPSAHQGIFGGGWGVLERAVGEAKLNQTFSVRTDCKRPDARKLSSQPVQRCVHRACSFSRL